MAMFCLHVCKCNTYLQCPWKPEKHVRSPGAEVVDNCEPPRGNQTRVFCATTRSSFHGSPVPPRSHFKRHLYSLSHPDALSSALHDVACTPAVTVHSLPPCLFLPLRTTPRRPHLSPFNPCPELTPSSQSMTEALLFKATHDQNTEAEETLCPLSTCPSSL